MMRSVLARVEAEVGLGTDEEDENEGEEDEEVDTSWTTDSSKDLSIADVEEAEERVKDELVKDSPPNDELPESIEGDERDESSEDAENVGVGGGGGVGIRQHLRSVWSYGIACKLKGLRISSARLRCRKYAGVQQIVYVLFAGYQYSGMHI